MFLRPLLLFTHPVAMNPPCGKYMQHRPLVMGAKATGDRSSKAQILRSLWRKGRGHDAVPAAKMKPLGSPEDTQTGEGFASHGSAPGRTVPCRASDMLRVAQHPGGQGPQLKVTGP